MNIRKFAILILPILLLTPVIVLGQGLGQVPAPQGTAQGNDLVGIIRTLLNGLLILASLAAVVFLIIGGVRYIVSQGDESASEKAKNTILYAVLGLIVIGLAAAIVNFIVSIIPH